MSFYTDRVFLEPTPTGWILATELRWDIGRKGSGNTFTIAAGFYSDLSSIPWWIRWLFNPADPKYAKAGILHDGMLALEDYSRVTAASEFAQALRAEGVAKWRCAVMGFAVLLYTTR